MQDKSCQKRGKKAERDFGGISVHICPRGLCTNLQWPPKKEPKSILFCFWCVCRLRWGTQNRPKTFKNHWKKAFCFRSSFLFEFSQMFVAFCLIFRCTNLDLGWQARRILHICKKLLFSPRAPPGIWFSSMCGTILESQTVKNAFQDSTQKNVDFRDPFLSMFSRP